MRKICVIGSINMDMVIETEYPPVMGETVHGKNFRTVPGGKGANQAIAAAKLGSEVSFIGAVGDDMFGGQMTKNLKNSGVGISGIEKSGTSGIAMIIVAGGDNTIVLESGANKTVNRAMIDRHIDLIRECDIAVMQLEIPADTVLYAMKTAKKLGKTVLLNPAPVAPFMPEMLEYTDIFVVNEHEAAAVLKKDIKSVEDAHEACRMLMSRSDAQIIITLGGLGCVYNIGRETVHQSAFDVSVVDTTGAGDSFIGAFCAEKEHLGVRGAIEYASAVSALTVSRKGASVSIPNRDEAESFLKELQSAQKLS